ncbi:MAG TPA: protoporphyrinogen oxidase [Candidatus Brachybacterium merdigallinarum]|nr:protoporphyrinogen oxidase [Candidatus Brachybacterium merdigallinarum]
MRRRVLVVGGGLAGLLAARRHQRAGHQVLLIEASAQVGGAIAATEVAGVATNAGAEAFSIGSGAVDALVAELGLEEQIVSPRADLGSRIVSEAGTHRAPGGSLLGIPGRPLSREVREVIGAAGALRASLERFLPAGYGAREGASVEAVVRRRLGRRVAERLVAPVVGGVHSADPRTLEFAAASPQLAAGLTSHGSLTAAVRALRGRSTASAGTRVHSLTPTLAQLPAALREEILATGGMLRTGVTAAGISRAPEDPEHGGAWAVRTTRDEHLRADHLVLATPPDTTRSLLEGSAPEIAATIPRAPSAPVRLVVLVLDSPALDAFPSGTGALVAPGTAGVRAKALTHASAKWPHVQHAAREALPEAGSPHVVRLSYGRPGEELPDREGITALALADASRILGVEVGPGQLLAAEVIDWDRAMRQALPGHRESLATLTDRLAQQPDLELVGSWRAGTGIEAIVRAENAAAGAAGGSP